MIPHKYGKFNVTQVDEYKEKLHTKIHWLLLYKDPNVTIDNADGVDFQQYYYLLLKEISGLNSLLKYPVEVVELLTVLQTARKETYKDPFNFSLFRKFILDAHSIVDRIGGEQNDKS